METIKKTTSQIGSSLSTRIATNEKLGSANLNDWILKFVFPVRDKKILDVGCGTGRQIEAFIPELGHGEIVGVDVSEECIDTARKRISDSRVRLVIGDMLNIDSLAEKNYFDIVISTYALYYSGNVAKTLQDMKQALKPDGKLVIVGPHGDNNREFFELTDFMALPPKVLDSTTTFMDETVMPFCRKHFANVKTDYFTNTVRFPTKQTLVDYWKSNIYHQDRYDHIFDERADSHFKANHEFIVHKKAMAISCSVKK